MRPVSGSKTAGKTPGAHSGAGGSAQPSTQKTAKTTAKTAPKTGKPVPHTAAARPEIKTESKATARDAFIKKVQTCMNTYNYADESTDVKGKVHRRKMVG